MILIHHLTHRERAGKDFARFCFRSIFCCSLVFALAKMHLCVNFVLVENSEIFTHMYFTLKCPMWWITVIDKLSSHTFSSKGLGVSSTCQADNIYRSYGIYNRTSKQFLLINCVHFYFFSFLFFLCIFFFRFISPILLVFWHYFDCKILQYINPIVQNSQHPLQASYPRLILVVKLFLPWLIP